MKRTKQGFTLIELLVVIAIIGLLSTLSIIALNSARARARDAKRISDVKQMQIALEMYYNENNDYPASSAIAPGLAINSTSGEPFLRAIPTPPEPYDGATCNTDSGNYLKTKYNYVATQSGTSGLIPTYTITFCIGQTVGKGAGAVTGNSYRTMTPAGIY